MGGKRDGGGTAGFYPVLDATRLVGTNVKAGEVPAGAWRPAPTPTGVPRPDGARVLAEYMELGAVVAGIARRARALLLDLPPGHPDAARLLALARVLAVAAHAPTDWLSRFAEPAAIFLRENVVVSGGGLAPNGVAMTAPVPAVDPDPEYTGRWEEAAQLQAFAFLAMSKDLQVVEIAAGLASAINGCPILLRAIGDGALLAEADRVVRILPLFGKLRTRRMKGSPKVAAKDAIERRSARLIEHSLHALGMPEGEAHSLFAAERTTLVFRELMKRYRVELHSP